VQPGDILDNTNTFIGMNQEFITNSSIEFEK